MSNAIIQLFLIQTATEYRDPCTSDAPLSACGLSFKRVTHDAVVLVCSLYASATSVINLVK